MFRLTFLLVVLLIWLQYSLWFGKNGLCYCDRINNHIAAQKKINSRLRERNNLIFTKIDDLNYEQEAIKKLGRNEPSITRSGEIFYRLFLNKLQ